MQEDGVVALMALLMNNIDNNGLIAACLITNC